ncbi:MAG: IMP dehydrogenase [Candidatus Cloacimonetes bacterium]|nr:IMP dehydrogenase [Candidatus Cloacimonadota bacterium]MCF7812885.1 IMP dehydrogenase [Candidatus Cloacimonadota bacterium]MCF7867097.1 IMP dehydrogenase [Candidatus Cloacimonadota bacterium]MCF7882583.1 IMP dehydrogenase [Candidatus Cloacimonadota bacterium]
MAKKIINEPSRTLMEYRLLPGLSTAQTAPDNISLRTPLVYSKNNEKKFYLNIPLVSAAMQSVSGAKMGIELAKLGGAAFIYSSQTVQSQADMIRKIKNHKAGFVKPKAVKPDMTIEEMYHIRKSTGHSTFPVVDGDDKFLGLISKWDYDISLHSNYKIADRMITKENIEVGINISDLKEANNILLESHKSVLPILDEDGRLLYLVFRKDINDHLNNPLEVHDEKKRLLSVASINTHDYEERVPELVEAEVDVIAIDSSDGFTVYQKETIDWIKNRYPQIPIIAGNVITQAGFGYLVDAGAAAIKVGMGGGSICITQEQKGTGRGLATTIVDVVKARDDFFKETGKYIPVIADGGVTSTKDITIALALGADYVMMGRYFARMEESPTEKIVVNNRVMKPYWGEGSARARDWKDKRYNQSKFVEGVEGLVEYAGHLRDNLDETLSKIKSSMGTCGAANLQEFHEKAVLELVSALSIREGKAHDIYLSAESNESSEDVKIEN